MDTIEPGAPIRGRQAVAAAARGDSRVPGHEPAEFDSLPSKLSVRGLDFFYGKQQALFGNDLEIKEHRVTAIIGPSGCGKSTHLRCYNRIYELYRDQKATGEVVLDGENILSSGTDLLSLRRRVGMIFQKPSPFPMTVFDNIAYGLRMHFKLSQVGAFRARRGRPQARRPLGRGQEQAERAGPRPVGRPAAAALHRPGDRRRARAHPHGRALFGDRPGGHRQDRGARPGAQVVVHDRARHPQHAAGGARVRLHRVLLRGPIIEFGATTQIFENPTQKQTEEYITGRFG